MFVSQLPRLADESNSPLTTRRSALGVFGLAGLSLIAAAPPVRGATLLGRRHAAAASPDFSKLPAAWVRQQGSVLTGYTNYLQTLRLRYVTPEQVIAAHAKVRGRVWNSLPPQAMWKHMGVTLKAVDRIAGELGVPVREITSAYRSPAYNARCPGAARGSWHQANVAVDVKFPVRASTVTAAARRVRDKGHFKGGVGGYSSFTHVDTRGQNTNW
jgi:hypothetical protein